MFCILHPVLCKNVSTVYCGIQCLMQCFTWSSYFWSITDGHVEVTWHCVFLHWALFLVLLARIQWGMRSISLWIKTQDLQRHLCVFSCYCSLTKTPSLHVFCLFISSAAYHINACNQSVPRRNTKLVLTERKQADKQIEITIWWLYIA